MTVTVTVAEPLVSVQDAASPAVVVPPLSVAPDAVTDGTIKLPASGHVATVAAVVLPAIFAA